MRGTAAQVFVQSDGNFRNPGTELRRLDNEFRSELHSRGAKVHAIVDGARKSAHSAVRISDTSMEKKIKQRGQAGIADIFVVPRHRSALDAAAKPIPHHYIVAFSPHGHKVGNLAKIVAGI